MLNHQVSGLISSQEALRLAKYDEEQLLKARKLVLVVDLDMTLIHTTVQPVPKGTKVSYGASCEKNYQSPPSPPSTIQ